MGTKLVRGIAWSPDRKIVASGLDQHERAALLVQDKGERLSPRLVLRCKTHGGVDERGAIFGPARSS